MRSFSDMWYDPAGRKKILIFGGGGLAFIIILIIIIVVATSGSKKPNFVGSSVLNHVPLVDGHNDLPNNLYVIAKNWLDGFNFTDLTGNETWNKAGNPYLSTTDLTRLDVGKVGGQFWAAYADCIETDPITRTLEQIDVIKRLIRNYPEQMELVTEHDGIMQAFGNGRIASLIGVEGGHSIASSMAILRMYYALGVRYMTLTHTCNTPWAESSTNTVPNVKGLTDYGREIVLEMNRLGMMVDLSHVSKQTMLDVFNTTTVPVIFSHSSAADLTNIPRNVDNEILLELKKNRGIIMVNFGSNFVKTSTEANATVTIDDVVAHLDHIKKVHESSEFVGIGADYDGVDKLPEGLEDVSKYPKLFDRLAEHHENRTATWNEDDLKRLASGNLIRVMTAVENYRDAHKSDPENENSLPPAA